MKLGYVASITPDEIGLSIEYPYKQREEGEKAPVIIPVPMNKISAYHIFPKEDEEDNEKE